MIVGISGLLVDETGRPVGSAGSGKDTLADVLIQKRGGYKVSFADPLKRIARDVYRFTDEQLWGPSQSRNAPDERYPRKHTWQELDKGYSCACCGQKVGRNGFRPDEGAATQCYLTPRYCLQTIGTAWGRHCYEDTWIDLAVEIAREIVYNGAGYSQKGGLDRDLPTLWERPEKPIVAIPDVRFMNEVNGLKGKGIKLVRIKRVGSGLANAAGMHPSEREVAEISDSKFDLVINNNGTIADLEAYLPVIEAL